MIISRGVRLLKNIGALTARNKTPMKGQSRAISKHSTGEICYRDMLEPMKIDIWSAEIAAGLMWWWVLWHMWHDWGHIVGEFPYPDASAWTDEELGIPPDDFD